MAFSFNALPATADSTRHLVSCPYKDKSHVHQKAVEYGQCHMAQSDKGLVVVVVVEVGG